MNKDIKTGKYIGSILNKISIEEIKNQIKNGLTIKQIALTINVSLSGLRLFLIRNNISYNKKIKYSSDNSFFDHDNEQSFYWAGFIAADGNITKKSDFNLTLKISDINHIEKFKQIISCDAPIITNGPKDLIINNIKCKTNGKAGLRFRNRYWLNSLKRFNIVPNKTKIYDIPEWIIEHELFNHFIRGYFDGDGWFAQLHQKKTNKKKICWGICGNLSVIDKIENELIKKCNIEGKPYLCKQINIYKLSFQNQHDVVKIINYLYDNSTIYLDRKYELSKLAKQLDENTITLNITKNDLESAYNRLKLYKLIAKEFGCAKSTIAKYMKKHNLIKK